MTCSICICPSIRADPRLPDECRIKRGEEATMTTTHKGECFCGAIHLEVSGEPEAMGYCHCRSCRSWSGGPVNAFTLWKPEAVRVTTGKEHIDMCQKKIGRA